MGIKNFVSIFLMMLCVSAGTAASAPFLPVYWSLSAKGALSLGWIMAGYALAKIVTGWAGGLISGRFGCMRLVRFGVLLSVAASACYVFLPAKPIYFFIGQIVYGAGIGLIRPMASAYVGIKTVRGSLGRVLGRFESAFYAALAAGPLIGGYVSELYGIKTLMFCVLICNCAALIFSYWADCDTTSNRKIKQYELNLEQRSMMLYIFTRTFGITAISMFLPLYLINHFKMGGIKVGIATAVICTVSAFSMLFGGYISDRGDKQYNLTLSTIFVSVLLILMPLVQTEGMFWTVALAVGYLSAVTKNCSTALLLSSASAGQEAYLMGLFNSFMNLGFCASGFIGGILVNTNGMGIDSVFYFSGAVGILGACAYPFVITLNRKLFLSN